MKHLILGLGFLLVSFFTNAQGQGVFINLSNSITYDDLNNNPATNRIRSNGNTILFDGSSTGDPNLGNTYGPNGTGLQNGDDVRAEIPLNKSLCNSWLVEFEFIPTGVGSPSNTNDPNTGQYIFLATSGDGNRYRFIDQTQGAAPVHVPEFLDGDMIGVIFSNPNGNSGSTVAAFSDEYWISPFTKDGTVGSFQNSVDNHITIGTTNNGSANLLRETFYIRLERLNAERCRLSVFADKGRNGEFINLIGEVCFEISTGIRNLNHIQFSNAIGSSSTRELWGSVSDLYLADCFVLDDCCISESITGDAFICHPEDVPTTYSVDFNPNVTYDWSIGGDVSFEVSEEGDSITVTDWGSLAQTGGTVEIILTTECNCIPRDMVLEVEVQPNLALFADFGISKINPPGGSTANVQIEVTGLASNPPVPTNHLWELLEVVPFGGGWQMVGSILETQIGLPSILFAPRPKGKYYMIRHTISFEGDVCPPVIYEKVEYTSAQRPGREKKMGISNSVFPNPSQGLINVEYTGEIVDVNVVVRNLLGMEILSQKISNYKTTLSLKNTGMYFVEIWKGETLEFSEKIIVNK